MGYINDLRKKVGSSYTLIMPCACAIITNDKGEVLLQQRVDNHLWGYHGGAIEVDESVEEALRRELKEELNIEIDEMHLFKIYSGKEYHHVYPNGDHVSPIDILYVVTKFHGDIKLQKEEVLDIAWYSKDNLPELSPNYKTPLKDFFESIK
jgi:8-oxo-dGTP pyrophosphatase MutT (NUDIX family)